MPKTSKRPKRSRDDALFHLGTFAVTRRHVIKACVLLLIIAGLFVASRYVDPAEFQKTAQTWPPALVIGVILILPLVGFPVSWLHLIAGVCFGFVTGLIVVLLTTLAHHLLGWWLVRILPRRWFSRFKPWREKLEGAGHREATLLGGLIPGMPYVVHLYVLPMIGTPLLTLCVFGTGIHTARAFVTILLGDQSGNLTPGRIAILVLYYALIFGVCAWALRRLQRRLKGQKPETGKRATKASPLPLPSVADSRRS